MKMFSIHVLRVVAALLAAGIVAALLILGAQPFAVGLVPSPWDKLAHVVVFASFSCMLAIVSGLRGWRMLSLAVCGAIVLGLIDEWHQTTVPGRNAGWDDLAADAAGGVVGAALLAMGRRFWSK